VADRDRAGGDALSRAREALAAARASAQAKGLRPAAPPAGGQAGPGGPDGAPAGGADQPGTPTGRPGTPTGRPGSGGRLPRAARRPRRDDPQPLSAAIGGLVDEEGWGLAAATGSVFGRWAQIVGSDLAGHTRPESLRDGELVVAADSTAWATQLRLLAAQLVHRLNAELGAGTVRRVKVRGPVTATRRPGDWTVRGSRGPRDTYG
jgi:predicted nucleic acid-binding Zn ribbon protein